MTGKSNLKFNLDIQFFAGSEVDVYVDAHKYTIRSGGTITVVENGLQSDAESTPFWVATNVSATRVFAGVSSLDEPDPDFVEYAVGSHITIDLVSSENYFDSRYSNILNRSKIISKIQTDSSDTFDIVPNKIANTSGNYYAELPTLTQNETIATATQLATKQDTLVSGTNIKTINSESILGSGDITIEGGGADLQLVDSLPAVGDEDAIYLAKTNVLSDGGMIEFPEPTSSDAGKVFAIDSNGDVTLALPADPQKTVALDYGDLDDIENVIPDAGFTDKTFFDYYFKGHESVPDDADYASIKFMLVSEATYNSVYAGADVFSVHFDSIEFLGSELAGDRDLPKQTTLTIEDEGVSVDIPFYANDKWALLMIPPTEFDESGELKALISVAELLYESAFPSIASEYSSVSTYAVGDLVLHSGQLYRCTTAISVAEAWDSTHWTEANLAEELAAKADYASLGTAATKNTGTSSGNVPILDSNGKLDTSVLPAIAVSEVFTAANQAAMLALDAQVGDVCVRTDESLTYILVNTPASTLSNWKLLEHPADAVSSVNGKTGVVTLATDDVGDTNQTNKYVTSEEKTKLAGIEAGAQVNTVTSVAGKTGAVTLTKSDVGLGNVDNTSDLDKPISTATQAALDELEEEMDEASVTITDSSMSKVSGISDGLALPKQSQMEMLSIKGNTIAWNQMVRDGNFPDADEWEQNGATISVSNNTATVTTSSDGDHHVYQNLSMTIGHKYFAFMYAKTDNADNATNREVCLLFHGQASNFDSFSCHSANIWEFLPAFFECQTNTYNFIRLYNQKAGVTHQYRNVHCFDLTIMYGAGNEPTSLTDPRVQWCINYALLHPEFASKLVNVDLTAYETTGRNLFDGEWEIGGLSSTTGQNETSSDRIRTGFIRINPNTTYNTTVGRKYFYDLNKNFVSFTAESGTFTTPSNACYMRQVEVSTNLSYELMLNAGSTALPYEPYVKHTYPLSWNGKSARSVYDEKLANGKEITRVKQFVINAENLVTFGTSGGSNVNYAKTNIVISDALYNWDNQIGISSIGYVVKTLSDYWAASFVIGISTDGTVNIGNNNFTTLDQFKALCPIIVNYQLATPTETDGDPLPNAIAVYQGGTEWQINDGAPATITKDYDISIKDQVLTNVKVDARQEEEIGELKQADYKTLYNLGEFDTVDTSNKDYDLVTRATGYLKIDGSESDWSNPNTNQFNLELNITYPELSGTDYVKCNQDYVIVGMAATNSVFLGYAANYPKALDLSTSSSTIRIKNSNYSSLSDFKASLSSQPIYIQYRLSTPYTEKVIKNRPLDTLDQNGSMFVRKEWEKGLNLVDIDVNVLQHNDRGTTYSVSNNVLTVTTTNGGNGIYFLAKIVKGRSYNFSCSVSGGDIANVILYKQAAEAGTSQTVIGFSDQHSGNLSMSFVADDDYTWCRIWFTNGYTFTVTNIMLNEGSHPYPYQPYNGPIVHEKETQELREKTLYNLGEYDSVDTSNSEYDLVTRATKVINAEDIEWSYSSGSGRYYKTISGIEVPSSDSIVANIKSAYYATLSADANQTANESIAIDYLGEVLIKTSSTPKGAIQIKLATPYTEKVIKNRPLNTLDQNGSMFVRKEWEKGQNVFNKDDSRLVYNTGYEPNPTSPTGTDWVKVSWIQVKPNTTYCVNKSIEGYALYNGSTWSNGTSSSSIITTLSDTQYILLLAYTGGTQSVATSREYWSNLMLVEGSHPYPYQPYNGAIVREKDINGTLLWENGNPASAFGNQTITVGDMSVYKYIRIGFKYYYQWRLVQFATISTKWVDGNNAIAVISKANQGVSPSEIASRTLSIVSSTQIHFDAGAMNGSGNDYFIVPVAIYGTNVL